MGEDSLYHSFYELKLERCTRRTGEITHNRELADLLTRYSQEGAICIDQSNYRGEHLKVIGRIVGVRESVNILDAERRIGFYTLSGGYMYLQDGDYVTVYVGKTMRRWQLDERPDGHCFWEIYTDEHSST